MDVIRTRVCFYDFYLISFAYRSKDFSDFYFISSVDNLSAVLWGDYYVILTPPLRSVYKELHADHETGAADNE